MNTMQIEITNGGARAVLLCSLIGTILLSAPIASAAEPAAVRRVPLDWSKHRSVDDKPLATEPSPLTVVCFLGTECPLTRLYGQRLGELSAEWSSRGVRFIGVNSNPQDSAADILQYIEQYGVTFPVVKDSDQAILDLFQAARTPEVFVLDASSQIQYHGRVDDQYVPGVVRAEPTQHDLKDALAALLAGRAVQHPETAAVGCLITKVGRKPPKETVATVTFARDVAPILNRRCVECHRAGEIGPFALTDYSEVVGWGDMMLEVIDQARMPPWHADPAHGKFVGERRIPAAERDVLAAWVAQGMPLGNLADVPPPPKYTEGWHLSRKPDLELAMPRQYSVPEQGTVDYQYFVVDPQWTEDRWISAAQVIPGDASVVHHAIVFVRPPDGTDSHGIGWLGAYVPGQRTMQLPTGHARRIPAGSKFVFQMHYTPNGRATNDRTRVGVWFIDDKDVTHEVFTRVALNHDFEIPPGAKDHKVQMRLDGFSAQSRLIGIAPHMHLRGKSFRLEACHDDNRETLLSVPRYDFNWQHWYQFESSLALALIDALDIEVRFDNSTDNPVNPAPDEFVTWGDQTWNEMAVAFLDISHPRDVPMVVVDKKESSKQAADAAASSEKLERHVKEFLAKMDRNGDGKVLREETPVTFQRFGFRRIDQNGDGQLERGEIESAAANGL